jgi:hypothetical protein
VDAGALGHARRALRVPCRLVADGGRDASPRLQHDLARLRERSVRAAIAPAGTYQVAGGRQKLLGLPGDPRDMTVTHSPDQQAERSSLRG